MIWWAACFLYLMAGVSLVTFLTVEIHACPLRINLKAVRTTVRWMDLRCWFLFGVYVVIWLPFFAWKFYRSGEEGVLELY